MEQRLRHLSRAQFPKNSRKKTVFLQPFFQANSACDAHITQLHHCITLPLPFSLSTTLPLYHSTTLYHTKRLHTVRNVACTNALHELVWQVFRADSGAESRTSACSQQQFDKVEMRTRSAHAAHLRRRRERLSNSIGMAIAASVIRTRFDVRYHHGHAVNGE